jgi:signal transduction histidine kinase
MFWLLITTTSLTWIVWVVNFTVVKDRSIQPTVMADLAGSAIFLIGSLILMSRPRLWRWAGPLVWAYAIFFMVLLNAYYVTAIPGFGHNAGYLFGFLAPAVVLYLRPRYFLPLLIVNHLSFCFIVLHLAQGSEDFVFHAVTEATFVLVLGGLANGLLFRSKFHELLKDREVQLRTAQLSASNAELRDRNLELDEFMAITAHDLRSPLQSLQSLYELESSEPEWQREPYRGVVKASLEGCAQMLNLIEHLLAKHQSEHVGGGELAPVEIESCVRKAIERAGLQAKQKSIALASLVPEDLPDVLANRADLDRVLDNLISNAVKFSPPGSTVEIAVSDDGTTCEVEVRDHGPGIPPREQERLFQKFERGSNRPTGGEASSGLGLFIARKLASGMGGALEYSDRLGGGSIFRLKLSVV